MYLLLEMTYKTRGEKQTNKQKSPKIYLRVKKKKKKREERKDRRMIDSFPPEKKKAE